ncbi:hypothetical protein CGRA01v4_03539 [Colletotrichum graminicola]|nr:hypothetical protein CGRA01v4_03539 [Colletotrichum graminicola]
MGCRRGGARCYAVINASRGGRGHPATKACTLVSEGGPVSVPFVRHPLALISGTATRSFETNHVICSMHASSFTPAANHPEAVARSHAQATRFIAKTRHSVFGNVADYWWGFWVTVTCCLYTILLNQTYLFIR